MKSLNIQPLVVGAVLGKTVRGIPGAPPSAKI